jgi:hypothetical protein
MSRPPEAYWATNLYLSPRQRPKGDAPIRDLPPRAGVRFKRARESIRSLKHVTEQVVYLGTTWKWVWMYEVGGRKLGYLHPMASGASATFVLTPEEEAELAATHGVPRVIRGAVRDGQVHEGLRWCWFELTDLDAVAALAEVVRFKHQMLARPE